MSLSAPAIRALATREHGDPFSVLGPHAEPGGRQAVRAFVPEARAVEVVAREGYGTHPGVVMDRGGVDLVARRHPPGLTWAGSASGSSGTWAGCTLGLLLFRWSGD